MKQLPFTVANEQFQGMRENQEDSFRFSQFDDEGFISHGGYLSVIADGMGGLDLGSDASQTAVFSFTNAYLQKKVDESIPEALRRSVNTANKRVLQLSRKLGAVNRMGTTLAAAVVYKNRLYWVSVGDSRIYLVRRDGFLHQLTVDQTLRESLELRVKSGEITSEEADSHPKAHALTNFIGNESLSEPSSSPSEGLKLRSDDWLILCSDGLTGTLSNEEISYEIRGSAKRAAEGLIQRTKGKNQPEQDNCSVLVLRFNNTINATHLCPLSEKLKANVLLLVVCIIMILILGGVLWYSYSNKEDPSIDSKVEASSNTVQQKKSGSVGSFPEANQSTIKSSKKLEHGQNNSELTDRYY